MGSVNVTPFTVTPRYKDDADHSWVTKQGVIALSVWMNSRTTITLEDVALLIEQYVEAQISQQLKIRSANSSVEKAAKVNYHGEINSMTFRGQVIERAEMATHPATVYMKDGENFSLYMTQRVENHCCVLV